ncbi:hypothetical protein [Clostridium grantii]|uniref:hypothetical protein n=1 Tax=Clostridium grantii TaxID=40575 RepID=UPI0013563131|nr:hypothetical protein [Clostridium grantii]
MTTFNFVCFMGTYKGEAYCGYLIKRNSGKFYCNVVKIQQRLVEIGYDFGI